VPTSKGLALTSGTLAGLACMHKYRFLTIQQFARYTCVRYDHAAEKLRELENRRIVGYFGYTSIPGHGKTPKVYFLARRGYEWLINESDGAEEEIGAFRDVHREFTWTPQMYHRLRILDCFIALECAARDRGHLELIETLLEYRRRKGTLERETTDYIDDREIAENRIVPDGAFVLGNLQTGRRGLFLLEMDMGTERITVRSSSDKRATIRGKFEQYDQYLKSGRFVAKYASAGDFGFFTLLFVTLAADRVENIRTAVSDMQQELHAYYRLTTLDAAVNDFVGSIWKSRDVRDNLTYALVQQP
jgi:protein involved in plasmid replication-relaxation